MSKPFKRGTRQPKFLDAHKAAYVEALAENGDMAFARIEIGFSDTTIRNHRASDAEFDQACDDAMHRYRKKFVDEMVRRGVDGIEEPVFYLGTVVGYVTRYSDRLLMEHLKVVDPRYQTTVKVDQTSHVTTTDLNLETLQPESRELLRQIIEIEKQAHARREAEDPDPYPES